MAIDWIKMRCGLQTDIHVVRILSALNADTVRTDSAIISDKLRVVGGLHAVWSLYDQNSRDGALSITPEELDQCIGWPGFTEAMISVGWLERDSSNSLRIHSYDTHNLGTAKRRAQDSVRKRSARSPQNVRSESGQLPLPVRSESGQTSKSVRLRSGPTKQNKTSNTLSISTEPKVKSFIRPTLEEIRKEIAARGSKVDPEKFFSFYESKGWKVGNQSMKNWRAAIVTWEKRDDPRKSSPVPSTNGLDLKRQAMERLSK